MTAQNGNGQAAANVAAATSAALATRTAQQGTQTMVGMKSANAVQMLSMYRDQIASALPKHLTPERVIQLAATMITRNPDIAQCTRVSLIGAVIQCSILGFEPIPALGLAYFVPRKNKNLGGAKEVNFQIGYKGLVDLARRSGEIQTIYAQPVHEKDHFDYEFGLEPKLVHKPAEGERGELTHAYAVVKYKSGGYAFEVMSRSDIEKIRRKYSQAQSENTPWNNNYEEMCRKTVLRRLTKLMPMSVDTMKHMTVDGVVLKPEDFADGEVDVNKVQFETSDGESGEATLHTQTGHEEAQQGDQAQAVNEETGEIAQQEAAPEQHAKAAEPEKKEEPQSQAKTADVLMEELSKLESASFNDVQVWYQTNLIQINAVKPAKKRTEIMDAFKKLRDAAKARS